MGLRIQKRWADRYKNLIFAGLSVFAFVVQPFYGVVASQVANAVSGVEDVTTQQQLIDALADTSVNKINLYLSQPTTQQIKVDRSVEFSGGQLTGGWTAQSGSAGYGNDAVLLITGANTVFKATSLTVDGGGSSRGLQGIQVYGGASATFNDLTVKNSAKAGLHVNGSTVSVNNLTTSNNGNSYGGVLIDQGSGVTTIPSLTVTGQSVQNEGGADINQDNGNSAKSSWLNDSSNQYDSQNYDVDLFTDHYHHILSNIKTAPVAPTLVSPTPTEGSVLTTDTATIAWTKPAYAHSVNYSIDGVVKNTVDSGVVGDIITPSALTPGVHTIKVQSQSLSGLTGPWSAERTFSVLANPTGLHFTQKGADLAVNNGQSVTRDGNSSIRLKWDTQSGVTGYEFSWQAPDGASGSFQKLSSVQLVNPYKDITGLYTTFGSNLSTHGEGVYTFKIKAIGADGTTKSGESSINLLYGAHQQYAVVTAPQYTNSNFNVSVQAHDNIGFASLGADVRSTPNPNAGSSWVNAPCVNGLYNPVLSTISTNASGVDINYSCKVDISNITDGTYAIRATGNNLAGFYFAEASSPYALTVVDRELPTISNLTAVQTSKDVVTISGNVSDDNIVGYYCWLTTKDGSTEVGTRVSKCGGYWPNVNSQGVLGTINVTGLASGEYTVHVAAKDKAGNITGNEISIAPASASADVTIDHSAPILKKVDLNDIRTVGGINYTNATHNGGFLDVTFTTDEPLKLVGSEVSFRIPGFSGPPATGWTYLTPVSGQANTYVAHIDLTNKPRTTDAFFKNKTYKDIQLRFRLVDTLGNVNGTYYAQNTDKSVVQSDIDTPYDSRNFKFTLDNTAPTNVTVTSPTDGSYVHSTNGKLIVTGTATDDIAMNRVGVQLIKPGVSGQIAQPFDHMYNQNPGTWSAEFDVNALNLADGQYGLNISAVDLLGNVTKISTFFTLDNSAPVVTVTPNATNGVLHGIASFDINVTGDNFDVAQMKHVPIVFQKGDDWDTRTKSNGKIDLSSGHAVFTVDTKGVGETGKPFADVVVPVAAFTNPAYANGFEKGYELKLGSFTDLAGNPVQVDHTVNSVGGGNGYLMTFRWFGLDNTAPTISGVKLNSNTPKFMPTANGESYTGKSVDIVNGVITVKAEVTDPNGVSVYNAKLMRLNSAGYTYTRTNPTVSKNGNVWTFTLDTKTANDTDGNSLEDGMYQFFFNVKDSLGNISNKRIDILVDNTAPAKPDGLKLFAVNDNHTYALSSIPVLIKRQAVYPQWNPVTLDVNGNSEDVAYYNYESKGGHTSIIYGTDASEDSIIKNWVPPTDRTDGFRVQAVDKAGNVSEWSDWMYMTYDSTAPVVTLDSSLDGRTLQGPVSIKAGIQDDNVFHYYITVTKDGADITTSVVSPRQVNNQTTFTGQELFTLNGDGRYTVKLEARDEASALGGNNGNKDANSTKLISFIIDNTGPAITGNATGVVSGTGTIAPALTDEDGAQSGNTYVWVQTSGPSATISNDTALNPTFTPSVDGDYVFTLTATDHPAGNVTTKIFSFTYAAPVPAQAVAPVTTTPGTGPAAAAGNGFTNVNITDGDSGVLGDSTTNTDTNKQGSVDDKGASTQQGSVKGASDEHAGCTQFLGICWYYWIPVVIVVLAVLEFTRRKLRSNGANA